jgi:hypothetical protein
MLMYLVRSPLPGSLSVSSMVQDKVICRLGSLGGKVCCWGCSLRYIIVWGVLLGVLGLGACVGPSGGMAVVDGVEEQLFGWCELFGCCG